MCKSSADRKRHFANGKVKKPQSITSVFQNPVSGLDVKRCSVCETVQDINNFHNDKTSPHGIKPHCKGCQVLRTKQRYWANPEKQREAIKKYYRCNPAYAQAQRQKAREWREANPEEAKKIKHEKYLRSRRYNLEYARRYRETASPERIVILKQQTRRAQIARYARWRAEKIGHTPIVDRVSPEEIIARDGLACYLCGKILTLERPLRRVDWLTLDHFIPLAKGGHHVAENLRIACQSCNSRKGSKIVEEFLRGHLPLPSSP